MKDRCFTNKIYISRVVFATQVTDKVLHENVFKVYVHMVIFRKVLKNLITFYRDQILSTGH